MHEVTMKTQCLEIVTAMIAMGATFQTHAGALGAETWTYDLKDETALQDCRRLLAAADRHRIGFNAAFIAAIRAAEESM
ncbi:hypothetical protein [Beijerinckia sp. L45]|uniref:hypothetical protein n=1 Tax=Beijerinckia sp. L45 TaxID=1641855 RepID=UPI00131C3253|nr:hypothetical protein [Beijerinckia sp. L45]